MRATMNVNLATSRDWCFLHWRTQKIKLANYASKHTIWAMSFFGHFGACHISSLSSLCCFGIQLFLLTGFLLLEINRWTGQHGAVGALIDFVNGRLEVDTDDTFFRCLSSAMRSKWRDWWLRSCKEPVKDKRIGAYHKGNSLMLFAIFWTGLKLLEKPCLWQFIPDTF